LIVTLFEKVQQNIREYRLLQPGHSVLLAVSGGADSMVLLDLFLRLAPANQWRLAIAHFNHQLRGSHSDADAEFVQRKASELGLPCQIGSASAAAAASARGISLEMAGRELRYQFLHDTAQSFRSDRVALAHHADDNVETFWLRLLRGESGPGLRGIQWQRAASGDLNIAFVRPLLNVPKEELLAYGRQNSIEFREDASNRDINFLRNRLRLETLPALEKIQPELRVVTLRNAEILGTEKAFLEQTARAWIRSETRDFEELHPAVQREVIRLQLMDLALRPSFELIEQLRTASKRSVSVAPGQFVVRHEDGRVSLDLAREREFSSVEEAVDLARVPCFQFGGLELDWSFTNARGPKAAGVEYLDAEAVGTSVRLRHWRPADRFQPIGLHAPSKLQDLFTNLKVPAEEKRRRVIALGADGKIFWVEGLRISEHHKVTARTRRILRWSWRKRVRFISSLLSRHSTAK
jgi:tRNA(Ile)-lysidine synthase